MIPQRSVQQVKDATRVEEVVGEFVSLKKRGVRYVGLCPFHNEKTPSFNVSPQLGIFKCFGCGESGDAISFLQKHEHLSFVESIRWLAKRYHIELEEEEATPEQKLEQDERESLSVVQQWAQEWAMDQLWNTDEGRRIGLSYFKERGFQEQTIRQFQLGYVPTKGDAFAQAAQAHGFDQELLEKAGWIKPREDGTAWDFFQGRVIFPIHGLSGQPIAFGARTLRGGKKVAKYFNSPESKLYVKSRSLYGIYLAKKAIVEQEQCLLVEGYTDVISLVQAGVGHVVASSGTSLTEDQVRLIKRYAKEVLILFDGDAAGVNASMRAINMVVEQGMGVKVVSFADGEDPDSFARSHSSQQIAQFLEEQAQEGLEFMADVLLKDAGDDPAARSRAVHELVKTMALVPDHVQRMLHVKRAAHRIGVPEQAIISEVNKVLRQAYRKQLGRQTGGAAGEDPLDQPEMAPPQPLYEEQGTLFQEREVLRLLLKHGEKRVSVEMEDEQGHTIEEEMYVAELIFQSLAVDDIVLDQPLYEAIYRDYSFRHKMGEEVGIQRYTQSDDEQWRGLAIDLLTSSYMLSPNWEAMHKIHVPPEDAPHAMRTHVQEALYRLKERRVDQMLKQKSEELPRIKDPKELDAALQFMLLLQRAREDLAKKTGRVVV